MGWLNLFSWYPDRSRCALRKNSRKHALKTFVRDFTEFCCMPSDLEHSRL